MFSTLLAWLAALPVYMVFNRIRGGGMPGLTDRLPGRALYYVAAILGALAAAILDPALGVVVAVGTLVCYAAGWGIRFDLHRQDDLQLDDPRQDDAFVRALDAISFGSEHLWMFWRLGLFSLPMLVLWIVLAGAPAWLLAGSIAFGALGVGAYEMRWRSTWGNTLSELLVGAIWWALVLTMALAERTPSGPAGFLRHSFY